MLKTDHQQAFHIHLPNTPAGSIVDASVLKEPASHRLVFAMTGQEPGLFEWADVKGPIQVVSKNGVSAAQGNSAAHGYKVTIPPHSLVAIELMGGIHHFHNIRGLSFHRLNMHASTPGNNITLNTQKWDSALPKSFTELKPQHIGEDARKNSCKPLIFGDAESMKQFMGESYSVLAQHARSPLNGEPESDHKTRSMVDAIYTAAQHCSDAPATWQNSWAKQRVGAKIAVKPPTR